MNRERILRRRIAVLTWFLIAGLLISGLTAIPLQTEVNWLRSLTGAQNGTTADWAHWLLRVQAALSDVNARHRFLFYGTDWLAFGHFVIAIAFVGALRNPVRNRWLFQFGMIACALVIPYALVFGAWRGIPLWWRLIDCSFGIFGFIPLWFCHRAVTELQRIQLTPVQSQPGVQHSAY